MALLSREASIYTPGGRAAAAERNLLDEISRRRET
jgi:hypothetical protein